jgi:signal peptidase I
VYGLYVAVGYVFVLAPFTSLARDRYLETFVVPSASMAPAILPGDRLFADKTVGQVGGAKLERGAIVVFVYPNDRTLIFVKRVAGLPGDRIELDGQSFVVPSGQIFVLGDDREKALDSRRFGTVPLSDVKAVARQVWFSSHAGEGVRWSRIGHVLR